MSKLLPQNSIDGVLRCARYAFMPNYFSYCGPDKNKALFEYCSQNYYEPTLHTILSEFEVMHPYLRLIARENRIKDEFDPEVVEAYWLGNDLVENVQIKNLYRHFTEDKNLKSKLKKSVAEKVLGLMPEITKPHHNFHVMNIWLRAGKLNINHTLKSIDECRISWGKVKKIKKSSIIVDFMPLIIKNDKIMLGEAMEREVLTQFDDKGFVKDLKIGDVVTIHWGWVCEVINNAQLNNLKKYTLESLNIFNQQGKEFLYA
jgi:hydrogenase maturation factor